MGSPNGNIKTLGDAVVVVHHDDDGDGDHAPTTGLGRMIAVGLMLSGIALLGVVTANIAAWFISRFEKDDVEERRQTAAIESLTEEVRALRAEVAALAGGVVPVPEGAKSRLRASARGELLSGAGPMWLGAQFLAPLKRRPARAFSDRRASPAARRSSRRLHVVRRT